MRASNIPGSGPPFTPASGQYTTPLGGGGGLIPLLYGDGNAVLDGYGDPVLIAGSPAAGVGIPVDSFGKWDEDTFRCFTTASGTLDETFLDCIDLRHLARRLHARSNAAREDKARGDCGRS